MVFLKVFFMNMYLFKKGYSQKCHHCIKACFNIFILSDIFVTNDILIIVFFRCKKLSFKEKIIFVGAFFLTNSFVNYISN